MDRNISNEAWFEAWSAFLITVENLVLRKRGLIGDDRQAAGLDVVIEDQRRAARLDRLLDLLSDLLHLVRHDINEDVVAAALDEATEAGTRTAVMITAAELAYIVESFPAEQIKDMETAESGIDAAAQVAASVERKLTWDRQNGTLLHGLGDLLKMGRAL